MTSAFGKGEGDVTERSGEELWHSQGDERIYGQLD